MCRGPVGGNVLFKRLVRCGPAKLDKWFRKRKSTEARLAGKSCLKGPTTERPSSPQAPCVAGVSSRAFLRLGQCRPGSHPSGSQLVKWTMLSHQVENIETCFVCDKPPLQKCQSLLHSAFLVTTNKIDQAQPIGPGIKWTIFTVDCHIT